MRFRFQALKSAKVTVSTLAFGYLLRCSFTETDNLNAFEAECLSYRVTNIPLPTQNSREHCWIDASPFCNLAQRG